MANTVRDRQTAAVKSMLNFGKPLGKTPVEPEWKVLIYDEVGQDIISPLMSVAELRELGVTLYLSFYAARDSVSDVAAIYFVLPTDENIAQICKDMKEQLYDGYYFNFISAISRSKLEDLASAALQANAEARVMKVFDQYVNFLSLEKEMFTLSSKNKGYYHSLNKTNLKDTEMVTLIDSIVDGLYCVFVSMGSLPIIRCPSGNAAEMVAEKLDKRLRDNLRDARNSFFSGMPNSLAEPGQPMASFQRPLLLVVDRGIDLATPLHHTWTYQALIHDVLDFNLNNVTISDTDSSGDARRKQQKYSLGQTDKFWHEHKGNPFPQVAEAVQEEIEEYKSHEEEVQRLKSVMGLNNDNDVPVDISDNTAKLTSAMSSLPELLEKKRLIDMHTTIATSVLSSIKDRKLDEYFELEEKIMSKSGSDQAVLDFISNPSNGTPSDKMRLFLIFYIYQSQHSEINIDQFTDALKEAGCDISPLKYIKRWRQYSLPSISSQQQSRGGGIKTIGMFSHLMSTGSQFVMEGVKNLVVKMHNLPITKVLDSLMELKNNNDVEKYRYLDPKLSRGTDTGAVRTKIPFNNAIVFVVGGGNYIEYHNLMDYVKKKPGKRVSYGCTDLLNADQFLAQLQDLGEEV